MRSAISAPTIRALKITGMIIESSGMPLNLTRRSALAEREASRVASEPKMISHTPIGLPILPMIQPTVNPGTAAGVSTASAVSASEI